MVTVINTVETCHDDMIHACELDYYGLNLATCSSDSIVKIFDVKNEVYVHVADLKGHQGPVWEIAWAHPKFGACLASCSYDRSVIVWKKTFGSWAKSFEYNCESSVNSITWAPHDYGMILACASSDGSIIFLTFNSESEGWGVEKITNAHAIGCNSVSWCPVSVIAAICGEEMCRRIASGGCDNCVKIWTHKNNRWFEETRLEAHSDWIRQVQWAPTYGGCKTLVASASQDRHVIIWSSDNIVSWTPTTLSVFDDVVWSLSFSFTGKMLAITGSDSKITLWKENDEHQWNIVSDESNAA